jgi:hypothetical protein
MHAFSDTKKTILRCATLCTRSRYYSFSRKGRDFNYFILKVNSYFPGCYKGKSMAAEDISSTRDLWILNASLYWYQRCKQHFTTQNLHRVSFNIIFMDYETLFARFKLDTKPLVVCTDESKYNILGSILRHAILSPFIADLRTVHESHVILILSQFLFSRIFSWKRFISAFLACFLIS